MQQNTNLDENVFCPIRSRKSVVVPCNMQCAWYDWGIGRCLYANGATIPGWMQHKNEESESGSEAEEYPED